MSGIARQGGVDPHDELVELRHVVPQELGRGIVRDLAICGDQVLSQTPNVLEQDLMVGKGSSHSVQLRIPDWGSRLAWSFAIAFSLVASAPSNEPYILAISGLPEYPTLRSVIRS